MAWFNRSRGKGQLSGTERRRLNTWRLRIEMLEDRRLLSYTCTVANTNDNSIGSENIFTHNHSGTLRYCITKANATLTYDVDTILFSISSGTINLGSALPDITATVIIDNGTTPDVDVHRSSGGDYRIITIASGITVTLKGLKLTNGSATRGGGIYNEGTAYIHDSEISGNTATTNGGGIRNDGTTYIYDSEISDNTATTNGGGIYNDGMLEIHDSEVSANSAPQGGGIRNDNELDIFDSQINENIATGAEQEYPPMSGNYRLAGGGIFNDGDLEITNTLIEGNEVFGENDAEGSPGTLYGGGIYNGVDASLFVTSSTIASNIICDTGRTCLATDHAGGGILSEAGTVVIEWSTIKNNKIYKNDPSNGITLRAGGGGIDLSCGPVLCFDLSYSTISGNRIYVTGMLEDNEQMNVEGGGISLAGTPEGEVYTEAKILNSTIANNEIYLQNTEEPTPDCGNQNRNCISQGGGIWYKWAILHMRSTTISENVAWSSIENSHGGGVSTGDLDEANTDFIVKSSIIAGNEADENATIFDDGVAITSEGYNLFGDDDFLGEVGTDAVVGDVIGGLNVRLGLAPLQKLDVSEPTETMAVCPGSWAEDHGGDRVDFADNPTTDQRGEDGNVGGESDMGAFECQDEECEEVEGCPTPIPLPDSPFATKPDSYGVISTAKTRSTNGRPAVDVRSDFNTVKVIRSLFTDDTRPGTRPLQQQARSAFVMFAQPNDVLEPASSSLANLMYCSVLDIY